MTGVQTCALPIYTSGDGILAPIDALLIINLLNRPQQANGEGESLDNSTSQPLQRATSIASDEPGEDDHLAATPADSPWNQSPWNQMNDDDSILELAALTGRPAYSNQAADAFFTSLDQAAETLEWSSDLKRVLRGKSGK